MGEHFRYHPDCQVPGEFEVVHVTDGAATCRSLARDVEADEVGDGEHVAPGRRFRISPTASVVLV